MRRSAQLLQSQAREVEIDLILGAGLPDVRVDPQQLHQVFLNLGLNGIQSMNGKGRLKVSTQLRRGFRHARWAEVVEVCFQDHGRGIPKETLPNIFIPFFTTRDQGTGLGLPICQRIIENHEGRLDVNSIEGKGSTFTVVLPTASDMTSTQS